MKLRDWMDEQRQVSKEIQKDISDIKVDNAATKVSVKQHIRRTDLLEDNLKYLRREFHPVKTHVAVMGALGKILIGAITAAGVLASIYYKFFM